jgi:hypothetical protein
MTISVLLASRRSAASVIFAIAIIPILGLCGLAIDYGIWARIDAELNSAANAAALNAVKVAAVAELNNDPNAVAEGNAAGLAWFESEAGGPQSYLVPSACAAKAKDAACTIAATVHTTLGPKATATVSFNGRVDSIFGKLFLVNSYPISGSAAATKGMPYNEVIVAADNSSSMDIAATPADINTLASLSACDASNAYYPTVHPNGQITWADASDEQYYNYACSLSNGVNFTGTTTAGVSCPFIATASELGPSPVAFDLEPPPPPIPPPPAYLNSADSSKLGQKCLLLGPQANANNLYPTPGPPCAFACHWDNRPGVPAGKGNDLWAAARRQQVSLRLDLVKLATQATLAQLQADNIPSYNNLSVGIYTFDTQINQYYPGTPGTPLNQVVCANPGPACEAGIDFAAAEKAVGCPPYLPPGTTSANCSNTGGVTDTGIQPIVGALKGDNDDTAFPEDMDSLGKFLTKSGDGSTRNKPLKELILVTDGFQDDPNAPQPDDRQAFDYTKCRQFKKLGYLVYVLYTPYYPVVHYAYLAPSQNPNLKGENWQDITQGSGDPTLTIAYNLQHCSSMYNANGTKNPDGKTYYISAAGQSDITGGLLTFLKEAIGNPARFTE